MTQTQQQTVLNKVLSMLKTEHKVSKYDVEDYFRQHFFLYKISTESVHRYLRTLSDSDNPQRQLRHPVTDGKEEKEYYILADSLF